MTKTRRSIVADLSINSENAANYIFSMFEALCEDIKLDKRNFDERYGKSFYEATENFEASVSIR